MVASSDARVGACRYIVSEKLIGDLSNFSTRRPKLFPGSQASRDPASFFIFPTGLIGPSPSFTDPFFHVKIDA